MNPFLDTVLTSYPLKIPETFGVLFFKGIENGKARMKWVKEILSYISYIDLIVKYLLF